MRLAEVCLLTRDVQRLAGFYKWLLGIEGESDDAVHQVITVEGIAFTVYNDGQSAGTGQNACLSFLVDDIEAQYQRLLERGVTVVDPPQSRPWGMRNLCFMDPDGNRMYLAMPVEKA